MSNTPLWDSLFREVSRRRVGGGPKTIGAEEITWSGRIGTRIVTAISRVRANDPMEGFMTCSSHRIRDSHVGRAGHWVDLRVLPPVTDKELELIRMAALSSGDPRKLVVTRGRHLPLACHDGRL